MVRLKRLNKTLAFIRRCSLNSTMVRLKPIKLMEVFYEQICLNSTMVRLKLIRIDEYNKYAPKSQFHYGSIKTFYFYFFLYRRIDGLNSTMVRLKPMNKI